MCSLLGFVLSYSDCLCSGQRPLRQSCNIYVKYALCLQVCGCSHFSFDLIFGHVNDFVLICCQHTVQDEATICGGDEQDGHCGP